MQQLSATPRSLLRSLQSPDQSPLYPASMNPNPKAATAATALARTVFETITLNGKVKFSGVVES